MAKTLKLKDTHPTAEKLAKLCAFAEELGISLCFHPHGTTFQDSTFPEETFYLVDVDQPNYAVEVFPPPLEYKILIRSAN